MKKKTRRQKEAEETPLHRLTQEIKGNGEEDKLNAPYDVTSSWNGVHALYVFTFRAGDEERKLFIGEEMVHLMFDGQPKHLNGYTLAELVDLAHEEEDEDEEGGGK
jgi:hypothetical protein